MYKYKSPTTERKQQESLWRGFGVCRTHLDQAADKDVEGRSGDDTQPAESFRGVYTVVIWF